MLQARRKRRVIVLVPRQNLLETMNALITPRLFSGLETSAPAAPVPTSSAKVFPLAETRRYGL